MAYSLSPFLQRRDEVLVALGGLGKGAVQRRHARVMNKDRAKAGDFLAQVRKCRRYWGCA